MMGCSNRNSGPECQEALSSSRSPPSNGTPGPEGQVIELVEKYREVDSLSPVLHEPLNKPDQIALFFQVLEHHLSLIKSRSQAFEDGHVTVYDKALLSLTQNGSDMHNMGALELYLDEVIGIRHGDNIEKMQLVLDRHIQLKVLLGQGMPRLLHLHTSTYLNLSWPHSFHLQGQTTRARESGSYQRRGKSKYSGYQATHLSL